MPGDSKSDSSTRPTEFPTASELQGFATRYLSRAFPNPNRVGCFEERDIRASFQSKTVPSSGLRAHLLACSDCFSVYRTALDDERVQGWSRIPRRQPRLALAFLAVGFVIVL